MASSGLFSSKVTASEKSQRYASDYISFVGTDQEGRVYLAHDNNRGHTGSNFFADHWITMFDEVNGWIDVEGSAHYPNTLKQLDVIPPSEHFVFEGILEAWLSFTSTPNNMSLAIQPIKPVLKRTRSDGVFWVSAAPATLKWQDRQLDGRVIFEYLRRYDWNRFAQKFEDNWRNFNGLYLMTDDGKDFYMHSHESQRGSDLTGRLVGMATWEAPASITNIKLDIVDEEKGGGESQFYWPTVWRVDFSYRGQRYTASLEMREKKLFA